MVKQEPIIYKGILISYIFCVFLMIFIIVIYFLVNKKSTREFILNNDEIEFFNRKYSINQLSFCEYYVWHYQQR